MKDASGGILDDCEVRQPDGPEPVGRIGLNQDVCGHSRWCCCRAEPDVARCRSCQVNVIRCKPVRSQRKRAGNTGRSRSRIAAGLGDGKSVGDKFHASPQSGRGRSPSLGGLRQVSNERRCRFVGRLEAVLADHGVLVTVTSLAKVKILHPSTLERAQLPMVQVRQECEVADGARTDGNDLDRTELGNVDLIAGMDLVAVGLLETGRAASKGRGQHLVTGTYEQGVRHAALGVGILHRCFEQGFRERSVSSSHRSGVGREHRSRTTRTERAVSRHPATHATGLTGRSRSTRIERGVLKQGELDVLLEFLALLELLIVDLARAASGLDGLLGIGDDELDTADLRIVADARGRVNGRERRYVIAFNLRIRRGGTQGVGLPFEVRIVRRLLRQGRQERGFCRADVIDQIRQFFTVTLRLVALEGIGRCSHWYLTPILCVEDGECIFNRTGAFQLFVSFLRRLIRGCFA